jgi:YHS domain-containing protein
MTKYLPILALAALISAGATYADAPTSAPAPAGKKTYPVDHCVVSGEKLGSMGTPFVLSYEGRDIPFCCKGCKKDFLKEPAKYVKAFDEAVAKAKAAEAPKTDANPAGQTPPAK